MYDRVQLVRRGLAFAGDCHQKVSEHISKKPEDAEKFLRHIAARFQSPGAIILLTTTLLSFVVVLCGVEYAIRFVATNLAIVEHTSQSGRIVLTDEPDAPLYKAPLLDEIDSEQKLPLEEQAVSLPIRPVTSGLRSTLRFIHSQGGFRARFRGLGFGIFYLVFMGLFSVIFQAMFVSLMGPLGFWLGSTVAAIFCCNAHATWTHAMIANTTSDKTFFQRFLPVAEAKKLVLPTIRLHAQVGLMHLSVMKLGHMAGQRMSHSQGVSFLVVLPIIAAIAFGFGGVLPAYIALIRTEASILPEDMTAIIPFDRTFGGRMLKLSETSRCRFAGLRNVTLKGAYMTFDRDVYKRTLKMLVKFVAVSAAFYLAFVALFASEIFVIIGGSKNVGKLLDIADAIRRGEM